MPNPQAEGTGTCLLCGNPKCAPLLEFGMCPTLKNDGYCHGNCQPPSEPTEEPYTLGNAVRDLTVRGGYNLSKGEATRIIKKMLKSSYGIETE